MVKEILWFHCFMNYGGTSQWPLILALKLINRHAFLLYLNESQKLELQQGCSGKIYYGGSSMWCDF